MTFSVAVPTTSLLTSNSRGRQAVEDVQPTFDLSGFLRRSVTVGRRGPPAARPGSRGGIAQTAPKRGLRRQALRIRETCFASKSLMSDW
jgi:hypothetical protein